MIRLTRDDSTFAEAAATEAKSARQSPERFASRDIFRAPQLRYATVPSKRLRRFPREESAFLSASGWSRGRGEGRRRLYGPPTGRWSCPRQKAGPVIKADRRDPQRHAELVVDPGFSRVKECPTGMFRVGAAAGCGTEHAGSAPIPRLVAGGVRRIRGTDDGNAHNDRNRTQQTIIPGVCRQHVVSLPQCHGTADSLRQISTSRSVQYDRRIRLWQRRK